eukprot:TRINITY_DN4066_c0_g1_i1.p1 TRINITY_DN4066_c0_g1~~TRINITY_DN4066_c0_g1_i1.p1  ORF type:complete len:241 (-),score=23.82 TRINITY_DN4066_c0_g1_i1:129-851(-)
MADKGAIRKLDIVIPDEYEQQIKLIKNILIKCITYLDLQNLLSVSLTCKQFYFLIKNDNFWKQFTLSKFDNVEQPSMGETWREKFQSMSVIWDKNFIHKNLQIVKNTVNYVGSSGIASCFSKFSFLYGVECVLIHFDMFYSYTGLMSVGICNEFAPLDQWMNCSSSYVGSPGCNMGFEVDGSINGGFSKEHHKSGLVKMLVTLDNIYYYTEKTNSFKIFSNEFPSHKIDLKKSEGQILCH